MSEEQDALREIMAAGQERRKGEMLRLPAPCKSNNRFFVAIYLTIGKLLPAKNNRALRIIILQMIDSQAWGVGRN